MTTMNKQMISTTIMFIIIAACNAKSGGGGGNGGGAAPSPSATATSTATSADGGGLPPKTGDGGQGGAQQGSGTPCLMVADNANDGQEGFASDQGDGSGGVVLRLIATGTGTGTGTGVAAGTATDTSTLTAINVGQPNGNGNCTVNSQSTNGTGNNGSGNNGGGSTVIGWTPGPGLDGCNSQNLAWVAVVNGAAGACGDALADWCCTEDEVMKRFPSMAAQLQPKFQEFTGKGLKLYNCSVANGKTSFHFGGMDGGGMHYRTIYLSGLMASPTGLAAASPQCPKVTLADMGITAQVAGGGAATSTDTSGSGGSSGGAGSSDGSIPASIGYLVSTAKPDILAQLQTEAATAKGYKTWAAHSNIFRSSAHQNLVVRTYLNATLADSLKANNTQHPAGAIAIQEIYDDAGAKIVGWMVLAKSSAGTGAQHWFTYMINGGPTFKEPLVYSMGETTCANCHGAASHDFIKSSP